MHLNRQMGVSRVSRVSSMSLKREGTSGACVCASESVYVQGTVLAALLLVFHVLLVTLSPVVADEYSLFTGVVCTGCLSSTVVFEVTLHSSDDVSSDHLLSDCGSWCPCDLLGLVSRCLIKWHQWQSESKRSSCGERVVSKRRRRPRQDQREAQVDQ